MEIIKNHKFIKKAKEIHNNFYLYDKTIYIESNSRVIITCPIHGDFSQTPTQHLRGNKCRRCAYIESTNKRTMNLNEFINLANSIHNNFYNYEKTNYKNTKTHIVITCPIHGDFKQTPKNHVKGLGCKKCGNIKHSNTIKLTKQEFIEKASKIHNYFYNYDKVVYYTSKSKIIITCPIHGDFEQLPSGHLRGYGCKKCKASKGEKIIETFLNKNKIEFIPEKTFNECKYKNLLPFDFYIPTQNTCIEFDGKQHYEEVKWFGSNNYLQNIKIRDNIKTNYCLNNKIKLIRIPYTELQNIESILTKELNLLDKSKDYGRMVP